MTDWSMFDLLAVAFVCGCMGYSLVSAWCNMRDARRAAARERYWRAVLAAEADRYLARVHRVTRPQSGVPGSGPSEGSGDATGQSTPEIRLVRRSGYGQGTTLIH